MRRWTLGTLIVLACLSLTAVVYTQLAWLRRAQSYEREQVALRRLQQKQLDKQFNDRVTIALTDVTERILSINKDPSDLFDAVKQELPNYFAVTINDTLHPYLLESLLKREFKRRNINEDFEYGIYDCFTDSIVYGNYVSLADSLRVDSSRHSSLLKLDKDGHYFGVYFPQRTSTLWTGDKAGAITWIYPAIVSLVVFAFFAYSLWLILRQRRLREMQNDFISNMTHELKTPISTIALSSEILSDPGIVGEPERLQKFARIIHTENERLRRQVERVLQLSKLESQHLQLDRVPVDLNELAAEAASSFEVLLGEHGGSCTLSLDATRPVIQGDRVQLMNVLFNLVDNAIKYSDGPAVVRIHTFNTNKTIGLAVSDRGIGIGKEDLHSIFDRFFRVHTGNVHNVKGFGLGLHYVRSIVRAHDGTVSVASSPGKGTTFTLEFPSTKHTD